MSSRAGAAKRFYETLLATEWASQQQLKEYQDALLQRLVAHAATIDFYAARLKPIANNNSIEDDDWSHLPTLDRKFLADNISAIRAVDLPKQFGEIRTVQSGGSTGEPLQLPLSDMESLARAVSTFRMFTAYGFNLAEPLIMIRPAQFGSGRNDRLAFRRWGFPWLSEIELGLRIHIDIRTPTAEQFSAIRTSEPVYINTLPSNLLRLGLEAHRRGEHPSVPFIISVAEYLAPETRRLAQESFGGGVIDILSSAEAGIIAIQCPESGKYHIQSELVFAEILDSTGRPCRPGEVGELVVTPLYNYATPLIRYRSGDFVTAGLPCPCGRCLPTIERVEGRLEHMFVYPDGTRRLPSIDRVQVTQQLGHDEWQLTQTGRTAVVFRFAGEDLGGQKLVKLSELIHEPLGKDFKVEFQSGSEIPLTSGGKRHHTNNEMARTEGQCATM